MATETIRVEMIEKPLSAREVMILAELENRIVKDFAAFYRVGQALAEINSLRLYRNEEGRTFEQYCKELWDISKSKAYQLIDASGVYNQLQLLADTVSSTNGGQNSDNDDDSSANGGEIIDAHIILPLNERQCRPLTKFKDHPEQVAAIWRDVSTSAPNGKVTANHVNKVVKDYLGEQITKTVHKARKNISRTCSTEFSELFEAFSEQIVKERKANYKYTSRGEIVKALDQLRAEIAEDGETIEDHVLHGQSDDASKLQRAGFSLFRPDRSSMNIKQRNDQGSWVKYSGPYGTQKEMEAAFKAILQDDRNLRG